VSKLIDATNCQTAYQIRAHGRFWRNDGLASTRQNVWLFAFPLLTWFSMKEFGYLSRLSRRV